MNNKSGLVFDIRKFSIHDGPGIRTTVFLKGCPLRCQWCHNPESQSASPEIIFRKNRCLGCGECIRICPQGAISFHGDELVTNPAKCDRCGECVAICHSEARELVGREMTIDQVMAAILQDQVFYDETGGGMTLSGGEPLAQAGFVSEILSACRQHQIHTALDTSGYASWKTLDALRTLVDLFLYDVKFIRDESHKRYTGVSNRIILENLERLSSLGHQAIVRLPIIPGITDTQENLDEIARFLAHLEGIIRLDILPYHNAGANKYALAGKTYSLDHLETPSDQRMAEIAKVFENAGLAVQIGG